MAKKRKVNRRKSKKLKKNLLCLLILFVSFGFIYSGVHELKTMADIKMSIRHDKAESKALDEKKEELEETKNNLTNPDYIEYISRGKYLVTKDGEQVFKFKTNVEQ